jgi:hypothetical protein
VKRSNFHEYIFDEITSKDKVYANYCKHKAKMKESLSNENNRDTIDTLVEKAASRAITTALKNVDL